jgi:F0F1-type ATP synthase assembly protein I
MDRPTHAAAAPRGRAPSGGELAGLGVFLAAVVVVPLLIGAVLDSAIHTAPLLLLAGLVLGIVAGGAVVYTRFKRYL